MKRMKKFISLLLAAVMIFAMAGVAFAEPGEETQTGSITIKDASNVSVAGKTFNAYKILDVVTYTSQNVVYTVPEAMKDFYKERYELTGNEGDFDAQVVEHIGQEKDMFAFAAAALKAAKDANITPGTATAEDGVDKVTISDLPLGYYVVEDTGTTTPVSALILDTTRTEVEVSIKANKPSVDKKIDGDKDTDENTTGKVENNNAAVGDKVPYKVTSTIPDMTGYKKYYYIVNDTLSKGLTFNDDVEVVIGNNKLSRVYYNETDESYYRDYDEEQGTYSDKVVDSENNPIVPEKAYIVETSPTENGTKVEIIFVDFIQYKYERAEDGVTSGYKAGTEITITYSATVNKDAVIGTTGNENTVTLTYSHNPNENVEGEPENPDKPKDPVGETPESTTRTYVTAIELTKVDQDKNRLTGAEFEIEGKKTNIVLVTKDTYTEDEDGTYWKLKDGTYTTDDPTDDGMDQSKYESTTTKYTKTTGTEPVTTTETVKATGTVGDDGILRFAGLSAGSYTITELKAPDGYNLLKTPISIEIEFTAPENGETECTWNVKNAETNGYNVENGIVKIAVENQSGTELPETGGTGTTMFYLLGGILAVGAAVLLVTKRRMSSEE